MVLIPKAMSANIQESELRSCITFKPVLSNCDFRVHIHSPLCCGNMSELNLETPLSQQAKLTTLLSSDHVVLMTPCMLSFFLAYPSRGTAALKLCAGSLPLESLGIGEPVSDATTAGSGTGGHRCHQTQHQDSQLHGRALPVNGQTGA